MLPPKPALLGHLMAKRSYDGGTLSGSSYLPYSMRGSLYGTFVFPVDAVYEIRFRAVNLRAEDVTDLRPAKGAASDHSGGSRRGR